MHLSDFVGRRWRLRGIDGNRFALRAVGQDSLRVFEAIEDKQDGYRSCLEGVRELSEDDRRDVIMFPREVAELSGRGGQGSFRGVEFVDADGHPWLRVGTDNFHDYYPCFVFSYSPPRPQAAEPDDPGEY